MLYSFAKIVMTIALRIFYRRVYVTGMESIPPRGPVILVANHTSSLMDAAILGVLMKRRIHYFARGDLFRNRFVARILESLNMIPVFHHEGGKRTLNDNDIGFERASTILAKGGMIVFFSEGMSHIERVLMPLRKGAFRLGFQTSKQTAFQPGIPVIPTGINYSHPTSSNADVMVHFSAPIMLNDYKEQYSANASAAILQVTKASRAALLKKVLHIDRNDNYMLADNCLTIKRNEYRFFTERWLQATDNRLDEEKMICSIINHLPEQDLSELKSLATKYYIELKNQHIKDIALSSSFEFRPFKRLLLITGFPVFATGYLLNALPILIARRIADNKVSRIDYYSWIFVVTASLMYLCWLVILFFGFLVVGWDWAIIIIVISMMTGVVSPSYINNWKRYQQFKRVNRLKKKEPGILKNLHHLRATILSKIFSSV